MSLIASALAWSNRMSLQGMSALVGGVQARYLAEGAVQLVFANLLERRESDRLLADGEILNLELPGGTVVLQITDESGKIDLNKSDQSMLARLFYSLDIDPSRADALADAIVDFRDLDSFKRLNGAEDSDYESAGLASGAKDAPFTSVTELRNVLGMDDELYVAIKPLVTVHAGHRGINPELAPLGVLMAVSDESELSLESYVSRRRQSHAEGLPMPRAPAIPRRYLSGVRGVIYNLSAIGRTESGQYSGLTTVVSIHRVRSTALIRTLEWAPYARSTGEESLLHDGRDKNKGRG